MAWRVAWGSSLRMIVYEEGMGGRDERNTMSLPLAPKADPCKFTNEVQQADKVVLPWEPTDSCHWKSVVRLPGFMKPGNRVGKSLQLWIARHRRSAGN